MRTGASQIVAALLATAAMTAIPLPVGAQARAAHPGWSRYVDSAAGMSVSYPAGIFSEEDGEPHEGRGQRLRTADGRATLEVYALRNPGRETPRSYLRKFLAIDRHTIEYTRVTERFFAISGTHDNQVFYSRCNFFRGSEPTISCIYLYYPRAETHAWDGIVTRISRSLNAGPAPREGGEEDD